LFDVLRDVRYDEEVTIHGCVGSCVAAAYPPWLILDSALSLGASINMASGAAAGLRRPAIALIGDYGLVHSGLSGHDQVYQRRRPVLTIVLANGRSAKTGDQPSPVARDLQDGSPLDLRRLLDRAAPTSSVHFGQLADYDHESLLQCVMKLLRSAPATLVLETGDGVHRPPAAGDDRARP
jgi:TPP-dependent indolepyruvate ferredoxin oxidoreductase alpha subunit